jgi:hypothetical protein
VSEEHREEGAQGSNVVGSTAEAKLVAQQELEELKRLPGEFVEGMV